MLLLLQQLLMMPTNALVQLNSFFELKCTCKINFLLQSQLQSAMLPVYGR